MPFDQTRIADVTVARRDAELVVSWASSAPEGAWFHVYADRARARVTRGRSVVIPHPAGPTRVEVGEVGAPERHSDLSGSLPAVAGGGRRLTLVWLGGTFLSDRIAGFRVYLGPAPGAAVNYVTPVATVAAYAQGLVTDGYGQGGYGTGGYGKSAGKYSWTSAPLASGTWNAAVRPFDAAGNEGPAVTWSVALSGPPRPPAADASGRRLTYVWRRGAPGGYGTGGYGEGGYGGGPEGYGQGGYGLGGYGVGEGAGLATVTLNWLASPG